MTDRELMQQALDALARVMRHGPAVQEAKDALRAAIEQAQEPVAWQGLTDAEREQFRQWAHPDIIEAIELRLQERNT